MALQIYCLRFRPLLFSPIAIFALLQLGCMSESQASIASWHLSDILACLLYLQELSKHAGYYNCLCSRTCYFLVSQTTITCLRFGASSQKHHLFAGPSWRSGVATSPPLKLAKYALLFSPSWTVTMANVSFTIAETFCSSKSASVPGLASWYCLSGLSTWSLRRVSFDLQGQRLARH